MEFTFKLNYQLSSDDANPDELVERLGEAGCDDALVGIGQPGRIALEFTREADNAFAALTSALADVKKAIPTAKLIEAGPDLVGLTDIADVVGVTRQNMRKLAVTNFSTFPAPVHEGSSTLWHLVDVLRWMLPRGGYKVDQSTVDVATTAKQLNLAKQNQQLEPEVLHQVQALLA
ncbi:DNA-binding protein [Rugamonas sp. FT107W]|uniref:DNA-binding protein n=1 Tax=Duganella vulcania TaxID=2692166 RepID=A0A845HRK5_9BURK|nr:DNA-binding protein [Duganella vulcania]MYN19484.1 DNA-binding protein [Duganella vulcania]